jgi:hypothetical protein
VACEALLPKDGDDAIEKRFFSEESAPEVEVSARCDPSKLEYAKQLCLRMSGAIKDSCLETADTEFKSC